MTQGYDVAVLGLGIIGAATLGALARSGARVVGLDRLAPPHDQGSSHGQTRMVRVAYAESPVYAPMARASIALWRDLENRTGRTLLSQSGVLYSGPPQGEFMRGVHDAAARHNVALEQASPNSPLHHGIALPEDWPAFVEPEGGYVLAEQAVQAFLDDAHQHGAHIQLDCPSAPTKQARGFALNTGGERIMADQVIITAGSWTAQILPELTPLLALQRRVLHWFSDPAQMLTARAGFRPFGIETKNRGFIYGFPALDDHGVKVAEHIMDDPVSAPDQLLRTGTDADAAHLDPLVNEHLPHLGARLNMQACLYTMTPDQHFIIDAVPGQPGLFVGAGFSGHGFKFAPLLGQALASMAGTKDCDFPYGFFALRRFAS